MTDEAAPVEDRRSNTERRSSDVYVVGLVLGQLDKLETRLGKKIDESSGSDLRRWEVHDRAHAEMMQVVADIEKRLAGHLKDKEHEDDVLQARLGPVRHAGKWLLREWRTVVIVLLLLADGINQLADTVGSLTPH